MPKHSNLNTYHVDIQSVSCFLQSENIMLSEKLKLEKEQNNLLRNQVGHLLQQDQDQKTQLREQELTIQTLQVGIHVFYLLYACNV